MIVAPFQRAVRHWIDANFVTGSPHASAVMPLERKKGSARDDFCPRRDPSEKR
jgi:hypothetical protein